MENLITVNAEGEKKFYGVAEVDLLYDTSYVEYGGAYEILSGEGAVIEIGQDRFRTSLNERSVTISMEDIVQEGPRYSWTFDQDYGEGFENGTLERGISTRFLESFTGKTVLMEGFYES